MFRLDVINALGAQAVRYERGDVLASLFRDGSCRLPHTFLEQVAKVLVCKLRANELLRKLLQAFVEFLGKPDNAVDSLVRNHLAGEFGQ